MKTDPATTDYIMEQVGRGRGMCPLVTGRGGILIMLQPVAPVAACCNQLSDSRPNFPELLLTAPPLPPPHPLTPGCKPKQRAVA